MFICWCYQSFRIKNFCLINSFQGMHPFHKMWSWYKIQMWENNTWSFITIYCSTINLQVITYSPTDACRNFDPILESRPTARATSEISAPVASHTADSELILDILWAKNAFAAYNMKIRKYTEHWNMTTLSIWKLATESNERQSLRLLELAEGIHTSLLLNYFTILLSHVAQWGSIYFNKWHFLSAINRQNSDKHFQQHSDKIFFLNQGKGVLP